MENFVEFLLHYYREIILGLSIVLEIVILIVKNFRVSVKLPESTLGKVLDLVNEAEKVYGAGHGKEKLNYVVERYLKENNVQKYFENEVKYWIQILVERILESPEKRKEIING